MGIQNREGALWMATGIDNTGLYSGFNQAEKRIDDFEAYIKKAGNNITRLTGIGFGVAGLKTFGSELINTRGDMQLLETSFGVLLGQGAKANAMLAEIKQYNIESPLSLNGISQAAQLLLGFNVDAEKVMPTLRQLGDISMGSTERFQSLALAFAQMSAAGKLMGQDLLQMINAGFNPLQEISKNTGKSLIELRKEMENGSISSEMVAQAFASATSEGGKFYGMTEKQAQGIKGLQAKLEGALIDAYNKVGKSQEGLIAGGYKVATALVDNYQMVGEALTSLIATYGLTKAAMVFNTSIDKTVTLMRYDAEIAELTKLLPLKEQEANADLKAAVASGKLTEEKANQIIALRAEIESRRELIQSKLAEEQINLKTLESKRLESVEAIKLAQAKTAAAKEELANAIATAEGEKIASLQKKMGIESERQSRAALRIVKLQDQKDTAIEQAKALKKENSVSAEKVAAKNREIASIQAKIAAAKEEEIQHGRNVAAMRAEIKSGVDVTANKNIQTLTNKVNTLSEKENAAAAAQTGYAKQIVGKKVLIKKLATDAETISNQINTAEQNINTTSTNFLAVAKNRAALAAKNLWAALAPNPYVLAAAVVVALAYGIYKLATAATAAEQAQAALNKQSEETAKKADDERAAIERLLGIIKDEVSTRNEKQRALDTLQSKYPSIFSNLDLEKIKNLDLADAIRQVNIELEKRSGVQTKANIERAKDILNGITDTNGVTFKTKSDIKEAKDLVGLDGVWERNSVTNAKLREMLKEYITKSENNLLNDAIAASKANFNALSKNEKISSLKKDVDNLELQYDRLKKLEEDQKKNPLSGGLSLYGPQLESLEKQINTKNEEIKKIENDTGKTIIKNKSYWEKIRDDQQKIMDANLPDSNLFKDAKKQRDEAAKMLDQWDKTNFKSQDSALASSREASLKLLNLQAELDSQSVKQQLDYEQKLLDIEQDSFDKRYRQNQLNMAKELVSIEEFRQKKAKDQQEAAKDIYVKKNGNDKGFNFTSYSETDLENLLPSGLKPSDVETQANNLWDVIFKAWQKGNEDLAKEQKVFSDEENLTFASQLDQQIYSIRKHYKERRKEAEKNAEYIKLINGNEDREITAARLQAYQRQLELDASYNQKVMELVNDRYAFESDRRKASIQQQISDQEELIETIEKILTNDPNNVDTANALRDAKIQLALFNKELSKTKTEKFAELANSAAEIASSLRDALGDFGVKLSDDTNKALDGFESILKGAGDLAEGIATKNPAKIISGAIEQTKGYFNAISGILGTADYSAYDKLKSKYENLLNIWDELIEKKKKYLSESVADEVVRTEKEALDLINKQADAVKKLAQARLDAGKSAGSHSLWYRMWKGSYKFDGKNWQDVAGNISKELGVSFKGMGDMLNMSADQLQWIKENYSGLWAVMDGDFRGYLEQLITYGDQAQDIINQAKESLTGISFDNLKDSFLNTLLDMNSDAQDFTDDFVSYFQKAIMQRMLDNQFANRLQSFYDSFAEANKVGGIDSAEYKNLQNDWNNIVSDALKERDKLKDIFGWTSDSSSSQSSSKGSFETITQDQAGSIDGRLTGIHEVDLLILQNTFQLVLLSTESNQLIRGYKEEFMAIRNVLVESRFLWEEIRDSNNELYEIKDILQEIKKNTKGLITK
nr:MAG TPA_asm: tail tape measure protein [Caudoviricetes sp.]